MVTVELQGGGSLADALAKRDGVWGAAVEETALRRMNVALGDALRRSATRSVELRAIIAREPDRGVNAFASLGPRLMIPLGGDRRIGPRPAGQPADLGISPAPAARRLDVANNGCASRREFPQAGWRVQGTGRCRRRHPASGSNRLTQFTRAWSAWPRCWSAASASATPISSFLTARLRTIATLKCLGAPERLVFLTYFLQLAALATIGVVIGLVIGAALPFLAQSVIADLLPLRARIDIYVRPAGRRRRASVCWSRCSSPWCRWCAPAAFRRPP